MKLPITLFAGFLEAGKTTYINTYLQTMNSKNKRILLVSYEQGVQDYHIPFTKEGEIKIERFSSLEETPADYFNNASAMYDEVFIEYNGTWEISAFLQLQLPKTMFIHRIICLMNASTFAMYIVNIDTIIEHIMNSNHIVLTNVQNKQQIREIKKTIVLLQPSIQLYEYKRIDEKVVIEPIGNSSFYKNGYVLLLGVVAVAFFVLLSSQKVSFQNIAKFHQMFFSIVLQAIPFLLIGIVFSSLLQLYISDERFIKFVSKHRILSLPLMIISGCMLPLCDCAMVPLTEKFIQKGVSIPLAMVFFTTSASINPIVILSTYYAFPENSMYVWLRVLISVGVALFVGVGFAVYTHYVKESVLKASNLYLQKSYDYDIQKCMKKGRMGRFTALGLHVSNEFFRIMVYVVAGALLSTIVQLIHTSYPEFLLFENESLIVIYMLFASIFLSICASSNAFIAKGFTNSLPLGSVFPFMAFGPLLDIKNLFILSSRFKRRFMVVYIAIMLVLFLGISVLISSII